MLNLILRLLSNYLVAASLIVTYHTLNPHHNHVAKDNAFLLVNSNTTQEAEAQEVTNDTLSLEEKAREDGFILTKPEENPYAVFLVVRFLKDKYSKALLCSGTLLSPHWVLTAAHCFAKEDKIQHSVVWVYAGGSDLAELYTMQTHGRTQLVEGAAVYAHPLFDGDNSDIALVRTKVNFNMTATVSTIELFPGPWDFKSYRSCKITAFGYVRHGVKSPEDCRRKTHKLEVSKPCRCNDRVMRSFGRKGVETICTKLKEDYGVCSGDSGGGLVCDGKVRGVANSLMKVDYSTCRVKSLRLLRCGSRNTMSIFLDTCPYLRWINGYAQLFRPEEISPECKDEGVTTESSSACLLALALLTVSLYL